MIDKLVQDFKGRSTELAINLFNGFADSEDLRKQVLSSVGMEPNLYLLNCEPKKFVNKVLEHGRSR